MNLLQITSALETTFGGPPNVVINAHNAFIQKGINAKIVINGQKKSTFKEGAARKLASSSIIHLFPSRKSGIYGKIMNIKEIRKFYSLVKESDCVISHQVYNFQNLYLLVFVSILKKPFIIMPHGTLTTFQKNQHRFRKLIVDTLLFSHVIRKSDAIAVATNFELNQLDPDIALKAKNIGIGIAENKTGNRVKPIESIFNFLYIGRLDPIKRIDLTILAFARFSQKFPDSLLRIAGDGSDKVLKNLHMLVTDLGMSEKIEFIGWVDAIEKISVFERSHFVVLNSEKENFAVGVAEGQSFGLPALVTRSVAFSEIIEEFSSGVVVENLTVEAILEGMLKIVDLKYVEISQNSLLAASSIQWPNVILEWIKLIEDLIENRSLERNCK